MKTHKILVLLFLLLYEISGVCQKAELVQISETIAPSKAKIYATAKETELRLSFTGEALLEDSEQPSENQPFVWVDPKVSFQTIIGIGGALTDASAETFFKLPKSAQQEFLTAYFDCEKGIGYNLSRTNIASCDFSSSSYDYVVENDSVLTTFSIKHDLRFKIPFIKKVFEIAGKNMNLYVSPWSPPAWMKDNNDRLHGGTLLDKYRQAWANYFVKFILAYEEEKVPIWGITVQNEPMAVQKWESCVYTAEEERDFIKNYLGPTLSKGGLQNKKLIVWDHNRDLIYQRASTILNDAEAAKFVWGIGFHWYETWTGSGMQFGNVSLVHNAYSDKKLIFTEGCVEAFTMDSINNWERGEKYAYSMINDFNNGTVAWTDWNVLLDEHGGPNHVGNYCFSPIHADTQNGKLIYTNSYYYIGHFSKFIQSGAKRIACSSSRDILQTTAFLNLDGQIVVVVLNTSNKEIPYKLCISGKAANLISFPHSIVTILM